MPVWVRTRTMPRWLAFLTYGLALVLLLSISYSLWVTLIFPAWVLIISIHILANNLRRQGAGAEDGASPHGRTERIGERPANDDHCGKRAAGLPPAGQARLWIAFSQVGLPVLGWRAFSGRGLLAREW